MQKPEYKEKRQILNWLCLFAYGSLNAVVLVRGHSLFRFEARRGRCTHIRETNKIFIVFPIHLYK